MKFDKATIVVTDNNRNTTAVSKGKYGRRRFIE